MTQVVPEIRLNNELINLYLFYTCILGLKMFLMSMLTARQRIKLKVYLNQEDCDFTDSKLRPRTDERVDRIRRAHLNDLENIPIFLAISFAYILTNPSVTMAFMLFRIYTVARFAHTFVYAIYVIPQPSRVIVFLTGTAISIYMAVQVILHVW